MKIDNSVTVQANATSAIANKTRDSYHFRNVKCPVCGKEFKAARRTAKYCSSKCRQTAKRDKDTISGRATLAVNLIHEIGRASDSDHKNSWLLWIRRHLDNVCSDAGIESGE
jgi:protein-arginine kinase activator protein McsA